VRNLEVFSRCRLLRAGEVADGTCFWTVEHCTEIFLTDGRTPWSGHLLCFWPDYIYFCYLLLYVLVTLKGKLNDELRQSVNRLQVYIQRPESLSMPSWAPDPSGPLLCFVGTRNFDLAIISSQRASNVPTNTLELALSLGGLNLDSLTWWTWLPVVKLDKMPDTFTHASSSSLELTFPSPGFLAILTCALWGVH